MKTLILGGMKSGKSRYAESLGVATNKKCTLIATATALDEEMAKRIQRHKDDRTPGVSTIEEPINLADALCTFSETDCVLIDCLTLWITNLLVIDDDLASLKVQKHKFLESFKNAQCHVILISNETNMGIVPMDKLSRQYCDQIGILHQELAALCHEVTLMVAGLPLKIKSTKDV
ncbi:MAG: bifunctional adenosylcobinamide kinase/adenosylcobinamide-phosphate guanylyltransferase [Granulosicoccus sp.]